MNMEGILGSEFMARAESRNRDARIKDKTDGSRRRDSGPSFEEKRMMLMQRIKEMRDMGALPPPPPPQSQPGMRPPPMQGGMTTFPNVDYLRRMGGGQPPAMPMPAPMPPQGPPSGQYPIPPIMPPNSTIIPRQPMQDRPGQYPMPPVLPPNSTVIPQSPMAPPPDPRPAPMGRPGDLGGMPPRGLLASTPPMPQRPMSAPSLPFENAPEIAQGKFETFREAFRAARKSGKKTFMWNGKKYTTKLKK